MFLQYFRRSSHFNLTERFSVDALCQTQHFLTQAFDTDARNSKFPEKTAKNTDTLNNVL